MIRRKSVIKPAAIPSPANPIRSSRPKEWSSVGAGFRSMVSSWGITLIESCLAPLVKGLLCGAHPVAATVPFRRLRHRQMICTKKNGVPDPARSRQSQRWDVDCAFSSVNPFAPLELNGRARVRCKRTVAATGQPLLRQIPSKLFSAA
jgi:hypothetical protein